MSQTDEILNDIRVYIRITAAAASRTRASTTIDTLEKAMVYEKFDGVVTQQKTSEMTGVPKQTVSRWADEFVRAALASAPDKFHASHKALFSLAELGIDVNTLKKRAKAGGNQPGGPSTSTLDGDQTGGGAG